MILADILCIFHTTGQTCAFSNSLQKRTKSCSGYSLMILIKGCKWPWSAWHSDTVNHSGGIVAQWDSGILHRFPASRRGPWRQRPPILHYYILISSLPACMSIEHTLFYIFLDVALYTLQFRLYVFSGVNVKAHILATFKYCLGSTYLYPQWVPPLIWTLFTSEDDAGQRTWKLQQKNDTTEQNAWNTRHDHSMIIIPIEPHVYLPNHAYLSKPYHSVVLPHH